MEKSKTDIEILLASVQEAVKSLNAIATRIDSGLLGEAQVKQFGQLMQTLNQRIQPIGDIDLLPSAEIDKGFHGKELRDAQRGIVPEANRAGSLVTINPIKDTQKPAVPVYTKTKPIDEEKGR